MWAAGVAAAVICQLPAVDDAGAVVIGSYDMSFNYGFSGQTGPNFSRLNRAQFLGGSWNVETSVGGIGGGFGAEVVAATSGRAGVQSSFQFTRSDLDVGFDGFTRLSVDRNAFGGLHIGNSMRHTAASFATSGFDFSARGSFILDTAIDIEARACAAYACKSGGFGIDPDVSLDLFRFSSSGAERFKFGGFEYVADFNDPIVFRSGGCPGDVPQCTAGFEIGSLTVYTPNLSTAGSGGTGGTLWAQTTDTLALVDTDVDFFFSAFTLLPQPGVGFDVGPFSASGDLVDIDALLAVDLVQRQTFSLNQSYNYVFDKIVEVREWVHRATFNGSKVTFTGESCGVLRDHYPGNVNVEIPLVLESRTFGSTYAPLPPPFALLNLYAACYDVVQFNHYVATDTVGLVGDDTFLLRATGGACRDLSFRASTSVSPTFETSYSLDLVGYLKVDMLDASVSGPGLSKSVGPVYSKKIEGFQQPFEVYRGTQSFGSQTASSLVSIGCDGSISFGEDAIAGFLPSTFEVVADNEIPPLPEIPELTVLVPAPASLALLGIGLAGLAVARRRRR